MTIDLDAIEAAALEMQSRPLDKQLGFSARTTFALVERVRELEADNEKLKRRIRHLDRTLERRDEWEWGP